MSAICECKVDYEVYKISGIIICNKCGEPIHKEDDEVKADLRRKYGGN